MDFAGFDNPDEIIGEESQFNKIMRAEIVPRQHPGTLRRYRINLAANNLHEDIIDTGDYEFPALNIRNFTRSHRYGYFAKCIRPLDVFFNSVVRVDYHTGKIDEYDFGEGHYIGEPVFCTIPQHNYQPDAAAEPGYLLVQVANGYTKTSALAILRAEALADGPIALIQHPHHIPISFHGAWAPRNF